MGDNRRAVGYLVCDGEGRPLGWSRYTHYLYLAGGVGYAAAMFATKPAACDALARSRTFVEKLGDDAVCNWAVAQWTIIKVVNAQPETTR